MYTEPVCSTVVVDFTYFSRWFGQTNTPATSLSHSHVHIMPASTRVTTLQRLSTFVLQTGYVALFCKLPSDVE